MTVCKKRARKVQRRSFCSSLGHFSTFHQFIFDLHPQCVFSLFISSYKPILLDTQHQIIDKDRFSYGYVDRKKQNHKENVYKMQIDEWDKNVTSNIYNFYIIIMLICYVCLIKLYSTPLCVFSLLFKFFFVCFEDPPLLPLIQNTPQCYSQNEIIKWKKKKENEKQKRPAAAAVLLRPLFHICTLHVLVQSSDNCTQFSFFAGGSLVGEELGDIMNYIYFRWYVRQVTQNDVRCNYQDKYISNEHTRDSGEQYKCC